MIPLSLFLLGCAAVYLGAIEAAFSALMRLSLRLAAERTNRPGGLGTYLDDPLLLFIPLVAANPRRMTRGNRELRRLAIALVLLIAASNAVALVLLIRQLVGGHDGQEPTTLLLAAGQAVFRRIEGRFAQEL